MRAGMSSPAAGPAEAEFEKGGKKSACSEIHCHGKAVPARQTHKRTATPLPEWPFRSFPVKRLFLQACFSPFFPAAQDCEAR